MEEIWRTVKGFPLYEVSNMTRVRYLLEGKIKIPFTRRGAAWLSLKRNGVYYYKTLGEVVAQAFLPNPAHKSRVVFINGDGCDAAISNLMWKPSLTKASRAVVQVKNGKVVKEYVSAAEAADQNGYRRSSIYNALRGYQAAYKGYEWRYKDEN